MSTNNYAFKKVLAHHFTGPVSDSDYGFRTVPSLLRAIADWMDENDVKDPDFQNLVVKTAFVDDSEDFYETASLYYLEPEQKREL